MLLPSIDGAGMTLPALREQYHHYALTVRNVCADTAGERLRYLDCLFEHFGQPQTVAELFAGLTPSTLTEFLLDYATRHAPGSRQAMHTAVRGFLRFIYEEQYMPLDLSGLVPTVRQRAMAELPRAMPDACISALEDSIERSSPAGQRDAAIVCLLSTYGVRAIQIRCLRLEHIDWQNERIHFPPAKRGRPVVQHLTVTAGNRLVDYITNGRPPSDLPEVFLTLTTAAALTDKTYLSVMIARRLRRAKIPVPAGVSHGTHGFRHAFAVRMTGQVPFKDLVDMLGHRDPSSALIYAKADVQTLQQAALPWPGASS
jgi:integrase/recombinase XerD